MTLRFGFRQNCILPVRFNSASTHLCSLHQNRCKDDREVYMGRWSSGKHTSLGIVESRVHIPPKIIEFFWNFPTCPLPHPGVKKYQYLWGSKLKSYGCHRRPVPKFASR